MEDAKHEHIVLVTGPAGCGKSTIAGHISGSLGWPFIEGDEHHPPANIEKMSGGIPLTDADRWGWLTALRVAACDQIKGGSRGVVVACSALKEKYRDVMRVAPYYLPNARLHFIFLDASEESLLKRVAARQNHYMGANMVRSQFADLEKPLPHEGDMFAVDVSQSIEDVKKTALDYVLKVLSEDN